MAYALIAWPDTAVLLAIFLLYSNAAVVAVKFHGVPHFVGLIGPPLLMAVPLAHRIFIRRQKLIFTPELPFIAAYLVILMLGAVFAQHQAVDKQSGKTSYIERFNNTLRQRCARLVRKTLSFSKKFENHVGLIKYFICDYNRYRALPV